MNEMGAKREQSEKELAEQRERDLLCVFRKHPNNALSTRSVFKSSSLCGQKEAEVILELRFKLNFLRLVYH